MGFDFKVSPEDLAAGRVQPIVEVRKGTTVAATDVAIERQQVNPGYLEYYETISVFNEGSGTIEALIGFYDGVDFHVFAESDSLAADGYLILDRSFFVREGHRLRVQVKSATADETATVYINGARFKLQ